jgi:O-antigen ligase
MPRLSDFFSFEAMYVCFLYAGVLKALPIVGSFTQGADLTLLITVVGIGYALVLCMTHPTPIYPKASTYFLIYLLFVCYAVISWALLSPEASAGGEYSHRKIGKLVIMTSWAVLAPLLIIGSNERIFRVLTLAAAMGILIAVPRILKGSGANLGTDSYQSVGRACGTSIVILAALLAYERDRFRRLVYSLALVPLTVATFWSGARQAIVGLMAALIALPFMLGMAKGGGSRLKRYLRAVICIMLLVAGLGTTFIASTKNTQADRIVKLFQMGERDGFNPKKENRPKIMEDALILWSRHPLFGAGYGGFATFSEVEGENDIQWPHNLLLEILCELGVIGLGLTLILLGLPLMTWLRECRRPDNPLAVALGCVWLFHLTCAMFSWDMNDNRIVLGLAAMIVANAGFRQMLDDQA